MQLKKVLISSFACSPKWGSEVGMGWNWITKLSKYYDITVITELGFKEDIENEIKNIDFISVPHFIYVDVGQKGREYFWKQGSFRFYKYYRIWQKKVFYISKDLIKKEEYDIIHQLNLIGFREPGYLWSLETEKPKIWGPVGGFNQIPNNYLISLRFKNFIFYFIKNIINFIQIKTKKRVYKSFNNFNYIISESKSTQQLIKKYFNIDTFMINETGCNINHIKNKAEFSDDVLKLLWVGKIQGLKALPIAIKSLSIINNKINFQLTILGDGPDEKYCKRLVRKNKLNEKIKFKGKVDNNQVNKYMINSDLLVFTSLKEGTPHVVLEALSNGLPVICHDACGHGDTINNNCGIKIPMISYKKSIDLFAENLLYLYNNKEKLIHLSTESTTRAKEVSWNNKVQELIKIYNLAINDYKIKKNN